MFKVITNPEFTHTARIMVPIDGGHEEQTIKARFRVLPDEEADRFDIATQDGLIDFLRAAVVSLDDMVDAEKQPISYSDQLRDQLLGLPYMRIGLFRTYMTGVTKAAQGN